MTQGSPTPIPPDDQAQPDAGAAGAFPEGAVLARLDELIAHAGEDPGSYEGRMIRDLMATSLKLIRDGRDSGEIKLMTGALKELRHAYRVFAPYRGSRKISIFGSARTPPTHPDYSAAVEFSRMMASLGWLVITGAGGGIMQAGHEGPGREASFGLAIHLPFETSANVVIAGDSKLINFRYFFTRKVMFMAQADAVAVFPGGYGTMDELYEALTLVQTGKAAMKPIVMVEGAGGDYWRHWENSVRRMFVERGLVSPEDRDLFYIADDPADAAKHVQHFYRNYHSSRYVKDDLVVRLRQALREDDIARLEQEFGTLIKSGRMAMRGPYEAEDDFLDLPRLVFTHARGRYGMIRQMIDRINAFEPVAG